MNRVSAILKDMVWNTFIGPEKGLSECYLRCGNQISKSHFECGHVISVKDNGPNICTNLRPICSKCNKSMSDKNMILFVNTNDLQKCPLYIKGFNINKMNEYTRNIVYPNLSEEEYKINISSQRKHNNKCIDDFIDYVSSYSDVSDISDASNVSDDNSTCSEVRDDISTSSIEYDEYDESIDNQPIDNRIMNKTKNNFKYYCNACQYSSNRSANYKRHLESKGHVQKKRHYDALGHAVCIDPPKDSGIVLDSKSFYCACCKKVLSKRYKPEHMRVCKSLKFKMQMNEALQISKKDYELLLLAKENESLKHQLEIKDLKTDLIIKTHIIENTHKHKGSVSRAFTKLQNCMKKSNK